jgi:hypothetical protein
MTPCDLAKEVSRTLSVALHFEDVPRLGKLQLMACSGCKKPIAADHALDRIRKRRRLPMSATRRL